MRDDTTPMTISFDDVLAARRRAAGRLPRTPTRPSAKLAALTGAREVWLKLENQFHAGSFKERGALNALLCLAEPARRAGVVTASAGNHAQALAYHATRLGVSAKIVMPISTPQVKVDGTRRFGGEVVLAGEVFDEAVEAARAIESEERRTFVHAFDDPAVIAGQGTATLELLEDQPGLDMVVIPVGGGGLIAGGVIAAEGVAAAGGPRTDVLGVETAMFPSLRNALDGKPRAVGGDTIAEGIAVKAVGAAPLAVLRGRLEPSDVMLVSESGVEEAIVALAMQEKTVVEGAGAAGLAALMENPERFRNRVVGLIICGGNIDARLLAQVLARHLVRTRKRARIRVECSDRPGRLAEITSVLRLAGANVIDVLHDRLALDIPAKDTVIDVIIETDAAEATLSVVERLRESGFDRARLLEGGAI